MPLAPALSDRHDARLTMRTLVTGAGGQLGANIAAAFVAAGDDVWASDIKPAPPIPLPCRWRSLDVTEPESIASVMAEVRPERIVHLAAVLSATGERHPELAYAVNQGGTYNMLEAARLRGTKQFIYTSSIAVFGPGTPSPARDDVELLPTTLYGATKVAGEVLGNYYKTRYDIDFRGVRYPGIIGATMPGGGTSDYALYMYYRAALGEPYMAFCRPDTRIPLMYDADAIRALVNLAMARRGSLTRCMYNVAAFSPTAQESADAVARAVPGARITFQSDPMRQAILDSWPNQLDDAPARRDWAWHPNYDLEAMTGELVPGLKKLRERSQ